jgi:predicted DNA-binding protein (MmcQ/YjbR family)
MSAEWIRRCCMGFPHATEHVQWGNDLVFKIGGKMFAVTSLEPAAVCVSFKCSPERFAELTERPGVIPAPYLARAQWVALQEEDAIPTTELKLFLREAYDLIFAKLPKKAQATLARPAKKKAKRISS